MIGINDIAKMVNKLYAHKFVPYRSLLFPNRDSRVCDVCGNMDTHVWHQPSIEAPVTETTNETNNEGTTNE